MSSGDQILPYCKAGPVSLLAGLSPAGSLLANLVSVRAAHSNFCLLQAPLYCKPRYSGTAGMSYSIEGKSCITKIVIKDKGRPCTMS